MTGLALVADVGGTHTRIGLAQGGAVDPASVARFTNAGFAGLPEVIAAWLADRAPGPLDGAAAAVAGPVRDGAARLTNLDWAIDRDRLRAATGAGRAAILNDLQAQGHALNHLDPARLIPVLAGQPAGPGATRLVIGVGTGFNAAPVYETPGGRFVPPAEAGHVCLPARDATARALAAFIEGEHGFPGLEEALSGRGLLTLHAFLGGAPGQNARALIAAAQADDGPAGRTRALFLRLLGQHAGDLALTFLPFGGVFLTGGMARALAPWLADGGFAGAFRDKGRFSGLMDGFAVTVIDDDFAALTGCATYLEMLRAQDG
jgi:glucokinase